MRETREEEKSHAYQNQQKNKPSSTGGHLNIPLSHIPLGSWGGGAGRHGKRHSLDWEAPFPMGDGWGVQRKGILKPFKTQSIRTRNC